MTTAIGIALIGQDTRAGTTRGGVPTGAILGITTIIIGDLVLAPEAGILAGADGVQDIMILGIPVGDIVGTTAGDTDPVGDMAGGTGILLAITDLCTTEEGMEVA